MFRTARCVKILGKGVVKVVHRCDQAKENNTLGSVTHGHCTYTRILSLHTDTLHTQEYCPYTQIMFIHKDTVHTHGHCTYTRILFIHAELFIHKDTVHTQGYCSFTRTLYIHTDTVHT